MKAYSHLQGNSKLPRQEGRRMKLLRVWTYNHFFSNGNRLLAQPTEAILSFSQWNSHQEDCTHSWLQQLSRQPPLSKPHKPKTSTLTFSAKLMNERINHLAKQRERRSQPLYQGVFHHIFQQKMKTESSHFTNWDLTSILLCTCCHSLIFYFSLSLISQFGDQFQLMFVQVDC